MKAATLAELRNLHQDHLMEVTLSYAVKDGHILLARKMKKIGKGFWNGAGGKVEPDESVEQAMIRETREELGFTPTTFIKIAINDFYHLNAPEWNMRCHFYLVDEWRGEITASQEMTEPTWFPYEKLPLKEMWSSDAQWLHLALKGKFVHARFLFDDTKNIIEQELEISER